MRGKKSPPVAAGGWGKSDNGYYQLSSDSLYQKSVRLSTDLQNSYYRDPGLIKMDGFHLCLGLILSGASNDNGGGMNSYQYS